MGAGWRLASQCGGASRAGARAPATPSSRTVVRKQCTIPLYFLGKKEPSAALFIPSVCMRTLTRSVGLARAEAIAPEPAPATIFFHSGTGFPGSIPSMSRSGE